MDSNSKGWLSSGGWLVIGRGGVWVAAGGGGPRGKIFWGKVGGVMLRK